MYPIAKHTQRAQGLADVVLIVADRAGVVRDVVQLDAAILDIARMLFTSVRQPLLFAD